MSKHFNMNNKRNPVVGLALLCPMTIFVSTVTAGERMVDYVSPSILQEQIDVPTNSDSVSRAADAEVQREASSSVLPKAPRNKTMADRLQAFEAEFGIQQKYHDPFKSSVQSAKYTLDKASFHLNEFVGNIEDALTFDYELWNLGGGSAPSKDQAKESSRQFYGPRQAIENARLKTDCDLKPGSRSFFGVRLELPFGD
jgi:hypothetical protein